MKIKRKTWDFEFYRTRYWGFRLPRFGKFPQEPRWTMWLGLCFFKWGREKYPRPANLPEVKWKQKPSWMR